MTGPRVGVCASGADAAEIAGLAALAEAANLDLLVVGNTRDGRHGDDTYVVTAAAAVAARTRYLRVGVVLNLRSSAPPLRVAEDLGVLDVLSNGRLELVVRPDPDPSWRRDLDSVLGAWTAWPLGPSGATGSAPVTPAPVQPEIPTWVLDPSDPPTARPLTRGAGVLFVTWPEHSFDPEGAVPDVAELRRLRTLRNSAGAATVVFDLAGVPVARRADVLRILGTVVAPCLRCPDDEVGILALDATEWLLRRIPLHAAPLPDDSAHHSAHHSAPPLPRFVPPRQETGT
jgi:alkanesulfonate monooxygenase SsuD/methylene tetrahydromethanopterin reductase-like flavin-dependent oxidoreductase (luciferase family)